MRIAYLTNQYPKTSHSFIRREIAALEAQGVEIERFSIRPTQEELVDPADKAEREKTRALLSAGALHLLLALAVCCLSRPARLCRTLLLAAKMGWKSERGILRHLTYVAEACLLLRWVRAAGADHLHAHFGTNSTAGAMFCQLLWCGGCCASRGIALPGRPLAWSSMRMYSRSEALGWPRGRSRFDGTRPKPEA